MRKFFEYDEDGDLVCVECGTQVRQMTLSTCAEIDLERYDGLEYECTHWGYSHTTLMCKCGITIPKHCYEWEWVDSEQWVLRINPNAIANKPPEE